MSITIMTASDVADIIMMTMKSMSTIITTMTASAAVVTIMMKMRSMNIIITTMVMSAAIITMTTSMNIIIMTMKDITMQMMYLQAGEKRRLTNMIKKHLMLFLKNLPIQMNMAVF